VEVTVRRLLIISLCLLGVGVLLLIVLRASRGPSPQMDEPEREPYWEPEPAVEAEPEPAPEPVQESAAGADQETEQMPAVETSDEDVVAPPAQRDDGTGRMAEAQAIRAEIVERVERRPLFVMAEERNVPYFRLFFMTKPELLEAILEVEHVPPHDVMPSQEALDRVREIAAEAYRRHEEIAAEEAELRGQASA
jgi:hypothetical protein